MEIAYETLERCRFISPIQNQHALILNEIRIKYDVYLFGIGIGCMLKYCKESHKQYHFVYSTVKLYRHLFSVILSFNGMVKSNFSQI